MPQDLGLGNPDFDLVMRGEERPLRTSSDQLLLLQP